MSAGRVGMGLALVAIAAASAITLVFVARDRGGGSEVTPPAASSPGIQARGMLLPRLVLFGDMIRARVDVVLDRRRVDPDSVRVTASFLPWGVVGRPERVRQDAGNTAYVRTTFVLRCLTGPCVPARNTAPLEFDPARVTFAGLGGRGSPRRSIELEWPLLVVTSRFGPTAFETGEALATPWRADLVSAPAVSYRFAPGFVVALLLAVGGLFAAAGSVLAYCVWPRRAPVAVPEPEPAPEPLTPLEHALALLEGPAWADGAGDQRRALELVSEALLARGEGPLAQRTRELAWSERPPPIEKTQALAVSVRSALEGEADGRSA